MGMPFAAAIAGMLQKEVQKHPALRAIVESLTDDTARLVMLAARSPDGFRVIDSDIEGHLIVTSAQISGCDGIIATSDDYSVTITPWKMSGMLCRANPDNIGRVWLRPYESHNTTDSWPLDPGDEVYLSLVESSLVYLYIEKNTDRLHIIRVR